MKPLHDVIYIGQEDANAWSCADEAEHIYWKEAIYEGDFNLPGDIPVNVNSDTIEHWAASVNELVSNGVKIPLPLGHTTDPEKNRGEILEARVGERAHGMVKSLFVKAKFNDAESAEKNKHTQVSIFSPPEFTDGKGNKYVRPITHVALTDYPVIPALQGFQSIAASFVTESTKEIPMPLKELATRLNIECDNEEQLADTIVASFETLTASVTERDEQIATLKTKVPSDPITVAASHLSMLKDNRVMKLSTLVGDKISPAVKDGLVELFCTPDSLTLSLSSENGDGGLFDKLVEVLAKNEVVDLGPTDKTIVLSKEDLSDPEKNPLLADAAKRAAAAK